MKTKNLKNVIVFLILGILTCSCSDAPEKPVIISHENYKLYVYPKNNGANMNWTDAMKLCDDLEAFGYDDWYLPNISELKTMYAKRDSIGNLSLMRAYWSSADYGRSAKMLGVGITGEHILSKLKTSEFKCRCVRRDK